MVRYLAIFFTILIITITNPVKGLQETQGQPTQAIREINKILPEIKEEKKKLAF